MLILRRRRNESIFIGPDVEIRVLEIGAGRTTLGIVAPAGVTVLRSEIIHSREANRRAARDHTELPPDRLASALRSLLPK
jgi:carbon storage regulator